MPSKRKASEVVDDSPPKRTAFFRTNAAGLDTPSRQTRHSAAQSATSTTPKTTTRVRRTYGKQKERAPKALQDVVNASSDRANEQADPKPGAESAVLAPVYAHGHTQQTETGDSPSKRRSKRISPAEEVEPEPKSLDTPHRFKRTYTKKLIVEVPPPPSPKPIRSPVPPPQRTGPPVIPRKHKSSTLATQFPSKSCSLLTSKQLSDQFHPCLNAQKKAILQALHTPSKLFQVEEENNGEKPAKQQLESLLLGTVTRSEGNSCLLLGPRGSGKSSVCKGCHANFLTDCIPIDTQPLPRIPS
jgi:origin recognition complex subunit 4